MEEELKRLRRENRELKRANGILKTAPAFFAVGVSGGVLFGWAWANQNALKDCTKDGNGVSCS